MIYDLGLGYFVVPLRQEHVEGPYLDWFNDQEVCRFNSHGTFPLARAAAQLFVEQANSATNLTWAIEHVDYGHIGNISLSNLSFVNRSADFGILIGRREHSGCGVGYRAARTLFNHGFNKMNLERIACGTAESNTAMIRLALKLGMMEEGRRRNALFLEGRHVDIVEFGLLRNEFMGQGPSE